MTFRIGSKYCMYNLIGLLPTVYLLIFLSYSFDLKNSIGELFGTRPSHIDWDKIDYQMEMTKLNDAKVPADNKLLVGIIQRYYIEPPTDLPYGLQYPEVRDPSQGQATIVDRALNFMEGGFYIECGAHDGEFVSNTLFFERYRNWTGILIEANPAMYKKLKEKHRKAFTLNACISLYEYPSKVIFGKEKIEDDNETKFTNENATISQCFPLYSILLALNRLKVDYFSLDVEGSEKAILDTVPWNKVDIKMMSVEFNKWEGGVPSLLSYLQQRGYQLLKYVNEFYAQDVVVMKQ